MTVGRRIGVRVFLLHQSSGRNLRYGSSGTFVAGLLKFLSLNQLGNLRRPLSLAPGPIFTANTRLAPSPVFTLWVVAAPSTLSAAHPLRELLSFKIQTRFLGIELPFTLSSVEAIWISH